SIRRHTRSKRDWSSDVCSSDLGGGASEFGLKLLNLLNFLDQFADVPEIASSDVLTIFRQQVIVNAAEGCFLTVPSMTANHGLHHLHKISSGFSYLLSSGYDRIFQRLFVIREIESPEVGDEVIPGRPELSIVPEPGGAVRQHFGKK